MNQNNYQQGYAQPQNQQYAPQNQQGYQNANPYGNPPPAAGMPQQNQSPYAQPQAQEAYPQNPQPQQPVRQQPYLQQAPQTDMRLEGYYVRVYKDAECRTITPKTGPSAGQNVMVVNFRAYHNDGTFNQQTRQWENGETVWLNVHLYTPYAQSVSSMIKDGMALRIGGQMTVRQYTNKDGQPAQSNEFNANYVAIDTAQSGIMVSYQKPVSHQNQNQAQGQQAQPQGQAQPQYQQPPF